MRKKFSIAFVLALRAAAGQQPAPLPPLPPTPAGVDHAPTVVPDSPVPPRPEVLRLNPPEPPIAPEPPLLAWAQVPAPPPPPRQMRSPEELARRGSQNDLYDRGAEYLDRREWDRAITYFEAAIRKGGPKSDGAYYWKAYSQSRIGQRDAALAAIGDLESNFPKSRWLNDARALALEVRQASGQKVPPELQSDEDLKLIAINALMESDPNRALPMLEKVLNSHSSPRVRERALFVLAHTRSPKAHDIVVQYAKGRGNPDLQAKAIEYLGVYRGGENAALLGELYASNPDEEIRQRILRAFMISKDVNRLLAVAKSESNPELRRRAVQYLGVQKAHDQLAQLYTSEADQRLKVEIIRALGMTDDPQRLIEVARTERDPELKREAVQRLATMKNPAATEYLMSILESK